MWSYSEVVLILTWSQSSVHVIFYIPCSMCSRGKVPQVPEHIAKNNWSHVNPWNSRSQKSDCTVEPVLIDHPICLKNVVCQDRWSLVTGSVTLKCWSFYQKCVVCQDRWSLMAGLWRQVSLYNDFFFMKPIQAPSFASHVLFGCFLFQVFTEKYLLQNVHATIYRLQLPNWREDICVNNNT